MIFLSVIIPTRNRAKYLSGALESLAKQTYPLDRFEVLVIDNGSTDNTREVCTSFKNRVPQLRYFYEETPGLHVGRHLGMKMAKSEILVYGDDDIEAFPTWLEGISCAFEDEDIGLVGGKNLPKFETQPPNWVDQLWIRNQRGKMIPSYSLLDFGDKVCEIPHRYIWGCNYSIRKEVLIKAGGFHPDGMPPDLLKYRGDGEGALSQKIHQIGYKALYHPNASVYHLVPTARMNSSYLYRRWFSQGISGSYSWVRQHMKLDFKLRLTILQKKVKSYTIFPLNKAFLWTMQKGFWDGVAFHQSALRQVPELLAWVLKTDYMDV